MHYNLGNRKKRRAKFLANLCLKSLKVLQRKGALEDFRCRNQIEGTLQTKFFLNMVQFAIMSTSLSSSQPFKMVQNWQKTSLTSQIGK